MSSVFKQPFFSLSLFKLWMGCKGESWSFQRLLIDWYLHYFDNKLVYLSKERNRKVTFSELL